MEIILEKKDGGYCECGCKGRCDTDYFELSIGDKKIKVYDVSDIFDELKETKFEINILKDER